MQVFACFVNVVQCPHPNCSPHQEGMCVVPTNVVRCPHTNCSPHQEGMCCVPTPIAPLIEKVCVVFPPFRIHSVSLSHSALSWILSKVENLVSSILLDESTDSFLVCYLTPVELSI